jgi:transcriptional regulatory protein RtcR
MKSVVISVLGTQKDAHGGTGPQRWDTWRPTIGLVQQESLPIDELHLIFNLEHLPLANRIKADILAVSPETEVVFDILQLKDPWDFEEVYEKFYNYSKQPCFHEEKTEYYIHMSTGSHVEQICLFLLAESRHLPAKLIQTTPKEGHVRHSKDPKGTYTLIDLDLSRYDKLAKRFETERVRWGIFTQALELEESLKESTSRDMLLAVNQFVKKIFPALTDEELERADADDVLNTFKQLINKANKLGGSKKN